MAAKFATIDEYIASFPDDVQAILQQVRQAIHRALPDAAESIRYGMPAVMVGEHRAINFAAWKRHVGLYPLPTFDGELEREVEPYRAEKSTANFPYSKPIPYDLIERVAAAIREAG
jgi:uncharacterized protein YdhG (YjbR/CyaY superfamily)